MNEQLKAVRAEIERLQEIHERNLKKPMERGRIGFAHGVVECCDRILSFIDSLPESNRPKLSDSLVEAAGKWAESHYKDSVSQQVCADDLVAGAKWQKEQMMKDAVECMVVDFSSYLPRPQVDIRLDPSKYHSGDKVRVIIVKEDER